MSLLKYALKELLNNKRFCLLFILNLALGLTGFIALDGFKNSLDLTIKSRSKVTLGGDLAVSARRPITETELQSVQSQLPTDHSEATVVELYSMVANDKQDSRLVQIKAIDSNFPFYGEIKLRRQGSIQSQKPEAFLNEDKAWIYPELLRQLDLKQGSILKVGQSQFVVDDVVEDDAAAGISASMAPRIYISKSRLAQTQLIKKGSVAWSSVIYKLPSLSLDQLNTLRDKIFNKLDSPSLKVMTHENASQQMTALVERLNDFLGLSSLVALFLAAVGTFFLFRSFVSERLKQVATLLSLGASPFMTFNYYLVQVFILGLISGLVAVVFALLIVPGLGWLTQDLLPFAIEYHLPSSTLILGVIMGSFGSLLICLPSLINLYGVKPLLLMNVQKSQSRVITLLSFVASLPALILFTLMAVYLANSYKVGVLFTILFFVSAFILSFGASIIFTVLAKFVKTKNRTLGWALRDLSAQPLTTMSCFVAIGLGALLLNLVPQVQKSLQYELRQPQQSKLPSLFMFDLQEEQLETFKRILNHHQVTIDQISPMIRARLLSVNDQAFDKGTGQSDRITREEENEMRFRNRGFNLSYREKLSESESLFAGRPFSGVYQNSDDQLPEISVEKRFADRLNLKIGDKLKFEIESIAIEGRIINLRSVQWTSFRPNFFVQFQPGVLEMAPKTFVVTIPNLAIEKKHELQDALVKELPNVSMVDVSRIVERLSEMMNQMSWALLFMSVLCFFAGFVVIYSIANHQASRRQWEVGLLKALGATFQMILSQFLWQFALISLFALATGALLSLAISYILSYFLFEGTWVFDLQTPLLTLVFGSLMTLAVVYLAIRKSLLQKVQDLFGA